MKYILLWYLYRDHSNYKRHNSIVFANPTLRRPKDIDAAIRKCLIDGEWFLHTVWNVPDMHFEKTDLEEDHPYHEYLSVCATSAGESNAESIESFLARISQFVISNLQTPEHLTET